MLQEHRIDRSSVTVELRWISSITPPPLCAFLFVIILLVATFYTIYHPQATLPLISQNPHNDISLHRLFLSSASNATISSYLRDLTSHPHLAGTKPSLDTLNYVFNHFQSLGLETHVAEYEALLSYPTHISVSVRFSNMTTLELDLNEPDVYVTGNSSSSPVVRPYHAYSPSGSAQGNVVFVNHGEEADYRALEEIGVSVRGCVVLARKGDSLGRGAIVKIAETKGALGVLIYAENDGGCQLMPFLSNQIQVKFKEQENKKSTSQRKLAYLLMVEGGHLIYIKVFKLFT